MTSQIRKIVDAVLAVKPVYWAALFVFVQAFLYFQPFINGTGTAFFHLAADKSLFARDIIKTSAFGQSLFYDLMHLLLGPNLINIYFLFWPYLATCALIAVAFFLIGKTIAGGKYEAGLLMLVMFLVQKYPIKGAYVSLIYADFHYQHFTLPFVFFAIYFLLKERYFYFSLFLAASFYFHLKTPAAIALAVLPLVVYEIYKKPKIALSFILPFALLIPKGISIVRQLYYSSGFTLAEKAEYMKVVLPRENIEGSMYFDETGITNLIVYALFAIVGLWTAKFITDASLRKKIYLCHAGVFFTFGIGTLVRVLDHYFGPLGEVVILGYARASILGTTLTMATLTLFLLNRLTVYAQSKNVKLFAFVFVALIIGLTDFYFTNFSDFLKATFCTKTGAKIIFSLISALAAVYIVKAFDFKLVPSKLIQLLLIFALGYVLIKGSGMVYGAAKSKYPFFPFVPQPGFFQNDFYEASLWAKENTQKDDLFLEVDGDGDEAGEYAGGGLRGVAMRGVWFQGITSVYGDASAFREWKRRQDVVSAYLKKPRAEWGKWFEDERINYIFAPQGFLWPDNCKKVFENSTYIIYHIAQSH